MTAGAGRTSARRRRAPCGWLEERTRLGPVIGAILHVRIPMSARTYYFGGIALFLFGIQVVTGTLLALYYKPTPEAAYESVQSITSDVSFGWLIRSLHHWAANLMILFVVLHLARIFVQAAYKYPREITWVVGCGAAPDHARVRLHGLPPAVGPACLLGDGRRDGDRRRRPDRRRLPAPAPSRRGGCHRRHPEPLLRHPRPRPAAAAGRAAGAPPACSSISWGSPTRRGPSRAPGRRRCDQEPLKPFFPNYILDEVIAWYVLMASWWSSPRSSRPASRSRQTRWRRPPTSSPSGTSSACTSCSSWCRGSVGDPGADRRHRRARRVAVP